MTDLRWIVPVCMRCDVMTTRFPRRRWADPVFLEHTWRPAASCLCTQYCSWSQPSQTHVRRFHVNWCWWSNSALMLQHTPALEPSHWVTLTL